MAHADYRMKGRCHLCEQMQFVGVCPHGMAERIDRAVVAIVILAVWVTATACLNRVEFCHEIKEVCFRLFLIALCHAVLVKDVEPETPFLVGAFIVNPSALHRFSAPVARAILGRFSLVAHPLRDRFRDAVLVVPLRREFVHTLSQRSCSNFTVVRRAISSRCRSNSALYSFICPGQ